MWSNWEVFHTLQGKSWPGEDAIAPKPDWPCFYQNYWLCFYQNSSQSPTGCLVKPDKLILNPSRRAKAQNWLGKHWSKNEGMELIPPNSRSNSMSVILAQRQKSKPMEQDRAQIQTHPSTKPVIHRVALILQESAPSRPSLRVKKAEPSQGQRPALSLSVSPVD